MSPLFRPRASEVHAVQLCWVSWGQVAAVLGPVLGQANPDGPQYLSEYQVSDTCGEPGPDYIGLSVPDRNGGLVLAKHGDWIACIDGGFEVFEPAQFTAQFEPA